MDALPDCRRVYAKTLHRLRRDMMLLQQVSRHAYKLGEPGAGGKPQGGAAPAPINLHAQDMLDQTETACRTCGTETGVESRPRWQTLLRDSATTTAPTYAAPVARDIG